MQQIKKSLLNSAVLALCGLFSLTLIVACSDGDTNTNLRRPVPSPGNEKPDENDPKKYEKSFAPEALAGVALSGFSEIRRAMDIMINGEKSESLEKGTANSTGCQKIEGTKTDFKVRTTSAKCKSKNSNYSWDGEESFTVAKNLDDELQKGQLEVRFPSTVLADRHRQTEILQHSLSIEKKGDKEYSYSQLLVVKFDQLPLAAGNPTFSFILKNEGTLQLNDKKEIVSFTPDVLAIEDFKGVKQRTTFVSGKMIFNGRKNSNSALNAICGRIVADDLLADITLEQPNKNSETKAFELASSANEISSTKSRRKIKLASCGKGFAALQADFAEISAKLHSDLGRTTVKR